MQHINNSNNLAYSKNLNILKVMRKEPPQIDMEKVKAAAARIMEKERAVNKIIQFQPEPPREETPTKFSIPPADSASRRYQRQIRKGCCGFNHHHFQHGS